jgi:hypothetical protein
MKLVLRIVLSAALAAAVATTASAQGRPGGFGGGGFGQISAYGLVATNKVLQDELKVTDEQKTKLEDALKPIGEKRRELFGGGGGRNATEEQRKEMAEKMAKLSEDTKKAVEGVLDAKQAKRLSEINVQVMGFAAFANKDVQEKLKLSDEQKTKIKDINEELQKDTAELRKDMPRFGGQGQRPSEEDMKKFAEFQKKSEALRKDATEKVAEGLTADQKKAWKDMVGEKFDTAKLMQAPQRRRDN